MRVIERSVNLNEMGRTEDLTGVAFTGEAGGHQFVITATRGKAPVVLGGSVSGMFIGPDGSGIELDDAEIDSDGRAVVTLKQACYGLCGPFGIRIFHAESGGKLTVIYSAAGYMDVGEPDVVYDPGEKINVAAITAMMDDMQTAATAATNAGAFVPNVIAAAYSSSATYAVGDYCTKDNKLRRCVIPINTPEEWTSAHWSPDVTVGKDLDKAFDDLGAVNGGEIVRLIYGKYISTNPSTINVNPPSLTNGANYVCALVPCQPGDKFTVTGKGGSTTYQYLWCFTESDGKKISVNAGGRSDTNAELTNGVITAPANAAYLIFNSNVNYNPFLAKNKSLNVRVGELETAAASVENFLSTYTDLNAAAAAYKNGSGKFDATFSISFGVGREPLVLGMTAKYTGSSAPTVAYSLGDYTSPAYEIGNTLQPVTKEWRVPPAVGESKTCTATITIPSGTVVDIADIYLRDDHLSRGGTDGIFWQGHSGFPSLIPRDTIESYQMAARLGFPAIIAIPHFTSDGVAVCIHTDNAVSNDLCMPDGTAISGAGSVGDYTYADLLQFDVKLKTSGGYSASGMKVPTLDEFFRICANCNMIPILSIHTIGQFGNNDTTTGVANFRTIRALVEKYGLLSRLMLKTLGNYDVQKSAYTVFGKEIGGYILLRIKTSTWSPLTNARDSLLSLTDSSDRLLPTTVASGKESPVPLIFELYSDASNRDAGIAKGIEQGFRVSVSHDSTTPMSGATMTGLIEAGVTSFCQDYHCSNGLNWW